MVRILLIFSMILNVIFIFYFSSVPPEGSSEQSTTAGDNVADMPVKPPSITDPIIPPSEPTVPDEPEEPETPPEEESETVKKIKEYVTKNIRKVAHFAEYAILAAQAITYIMIFSKKRIFHTALTLLGGLTLAFVDEFVVQSLSGRVSSIDDVMLDMSGFVSLVVISYLFVFIFKGMNWLVTRKD